MHPRERVLGIACLCSEQGQEIPKHVLKEAEALGVDLSLINKHKQKLQQQEVKESGDGSETMRCEP